MLSTSRAKALVIFLPSLLAGADDSSIEIVQYAGARWERTHKYDCWHNDIKTYPVPVVMGEPGAEDYLEQCAQHCLDTENCVAFNYPSNEFPDKNRPYDPKVCYLKEISMQSEHLGVSCEKAFLVHIWDYYSLLDHKIWARMALGLQKERYPFARHMEFTSENAVWVNNVRWRTVPGQNCQGETILTKEITASNTDTMTLGACAKTCADDQECMGFQYPNDPSVQDAACVLKAFKTSSLLNSGTCDAYGTSDWTFYFLVDAWHIFHNENADWVRIAKRNRLVGPPGGACAGDREGYWVHGVTGEKVETDYESCCYFQLSECEYNTTSNCKPFIVHPAGCRGLCKTEKASCHCWTQPNVAPKDDCCLSCSMDCNGKSTCEPATCSGPENMCSSKQQMGSGSACVCTAQGLEPLKEFVPADVAAGWKTDSLVWS